MNICRFFIKGTVIVIESKPHFIGDMSNLQRYPWYYTLFLNSIEKQNTENLIESDAVPPIIYLQMKETADPENSEHEFTHRIPCCSKS